jgi:hypothetical protein
MDDIVERLRDFCVCDDGHPEQCVECEAADEIERLQARAKELEKRLRDVVAVIAECPSFWMTKRLELIADAAGFEKCERCKCDQCSDVGDIHEHGPLGADYIDTCDCISGWSEKDD